MGCRQFLPHSVAQLKGKHCRKPHWRNGVVDTLGPSFHRSMHQKQHYWPSTLYFMNTKMTIKTYHYHSIFWWSGQSFASGRLTFGHTIESSIVTCNLRNITFQFVIVITFNGNVFSMHYGVPIASVVYDRNHVLVSETETKIKFRCWYRSGNFFFPNQIFFSNFFKFFSWFPTSWRDISF